MNVKIPSLYISLFPSFLFKIMFRIINGIAKKGVIRIGSPIPNNIFSQISAFLNSGLLYPNINKTIKANKQIGVNPKSWTQCYL